MAIPSTRASRASFVFGAVGVICVSLLLPAALGVRRALAARAPAVHIRLEVRAADPPGSPPFAQAECVAALDPCDVAFDVDDARVALRIEAREGRRGIHLTVRPLMGGAALRDGVVDEGSPLVVPLGTQIALWLVPTRLR